MVKKSTQKFIAQLNIQLWQNEHAIDEALIQTIFFSLHCVFMFVFPIEGSPLNWRLGLMKEGLRMLFGIWGLGILASSVVVDC